jgi:hypothetical protein
MAGIGFVFPGMVKTASEVRYSLGASREIARQLARTTSATRAAKLAARITQHGEEIAEALINQVLIQAAKRFGREVVGSTPRTR